MKTINSSRRLNILQIVLTIEVLYYLHYLTFQIKLFLNKRLATSYWIYLCVCLNYKPRWCILCVQRSFQNWQRIVTAWRKKSLGKNGTSCWQKDTRDLCLRMSPESTILCFVARMRGVFLYQYQRHFISWLEWDELLIEGYILCLQTSP